MIGHEFVIVGDVIKSRVEFDPDKWEYFHQSIETMNTQFAESLKIPFSIYSGDSFGAVSRDIGSALKIILAIQEVQRYQNSRIVLIEDEVTFGVEKNNFLSLEGPALWKSEELLTQLKKNKSFFLADLKESLTTKVINTILNLIIAIRSNWNNTEWLVYKRSSQDVKQKDIATDLNISQQYVSKLMIHSNIKLVKSSEAELLAIVDNIMEKSI